VHRLIHPSLWGRTRSKAEGATVHRTVAGRNLTLLRLRSASVKFFPVLGHGALSRRFALLPRTDLSYCLIAGLILLSSFTGTYRAPRLRRGGLLAVRPRLRAHPRSATRSADTCRPQRRAAHARRCAERRRAKEKTDSVVAKQPLSVLS
jgi:hypothetical protein